MLSPETMRRLVFADTKFNRQIDRLLRGGRATAHSKCRVITEVGTPALDVR
jgi:hypothetical protein